MRGLTHRRLIRSSLAVAAVAAFCLPAMAEQAYTTRIEPRAFYGATVTMEEGVRVFRPLPPHRQVIVNPGNVPLNLGFNDTRVTQRSVNHNYNYGGGFGHGSVYGGFNSGGKRVYTGPAPAPLRPY